MKIRIACVLLLSCCTVAALSARSLPQNSRGTLAYFCLGGSNPEIQTINSSLASLGRPGFASRFSVTGGGIGFFVNRIYWGIAVNLFSNASGKVEAEQYWAKLTAFDGALQVGYQLFSKSGLRLYPCAGLGYGDVRLKMVDITYHEYLSSGYEKKVHAREHVCPVKADGFRGQVGLALDCIISAEKIDTGTVNGIVLGARTGYAFCLGDHWNMNFPGIHGASSVAFNGFFFSLILGFGSGRVY